MRKMQVHPKSQVHLQSQPRMLKIVKRRWELRMNRTFDKDDEWELRMNRTFDKDDEDEADNYNEITPITYHKKGKERL
jgi:hypothetical protein